MDIKEQWKKLNKTMAAIALVGGFIFDGAVQEFRAALLMQAIIVGVTSVVIYKVISRDLPKQP